MNLIASLAQTMDEIFGVNKDLERSGNRFDQILMMQEVPLLNEAPAPKGERVRTRGIERSFEGGS